MEKDIKNTITDIKQSIRHLATLGVPIRQIVDAIKSVEEELAENEDERICGQLIAFLKQSKAVYGDGFKQFGLNIDDALAWLEKQGEQKQCEDVETKVSYAYFDGQINGRDRVLLNPENYGLERIKQTAEWSEEDKKMLKELINYCDLSIQYNGIESPQAIKWKKRKEWLRTLKDRVQSQPQSDERNRLLGKLEEWLDEYLRIVKQK